ncbi:MAG: zinc-binding dehydrogenase [Propionibacteriaceae bacterium]|nr:zinc-binding dehydrogenase [Propionibacteriaceae bacterium]
MRVLRLHNVSDLRLHDEPAPQPAEDHCLVKVRAVGLCGSDLHWFAEGGIGDASLERPLVPGHEFAGVALDGPYAARLVAVDPAMPCRACELCSAGHPNLCPGIAFAGHSTTDGGLQEIVSWPTHLLHPLPDSMTPADGAMLEPLGVALHAWDLASPHVGSTVAVVGAGPIGLLMIQLALASGASRVIAVEPLEHRRAAARRFGAEALTPEEAHDPETWRSLTGFGVDVAFEIAGSDDAVAVSALACRPGGRLVIVGIPSDDRYTLPAGTVRRKGLTILVVRRMKEMYPRTIALVENGKVDVSSIVSAVYGMDAATSAFTSASRREGLKVVIDPNE